MYVDFKTTVWERIRVPEEKENDLLAKIELGLINSINDVLTDDVQSEEYDYEILVDTSEQMEPNENGGQSTIEVHSCENLLKDKIYWQNGN